MTKNLCIFAHYDQHGVVADHVLHHLRSLQDCNFSVVLVSTAKLTQNTVDRLNDEGVDVILRENIGYDFGSWSVGFAHYKDTFDGDLLLANDSVYGPIGSLDTVLARLTAQAADIYGMVESREYTSHLQSWFLLFRARVWKHATFSSLFCRPPSALSKQDIIAQFELTATQMLRDAGFSTRSLYTADEPRLAVNPSHLLWRELIEEYGVCFIKVELLATNPAHVGNIDGWREVVRKRSPELVPMIETHLRRVGRPNSGAVSGAKAPSLAHKTFTCLVRNDDLFRRRQMLGLRRINFEIFRAARAVMRYWRVAIHAVAARSNQERDTGNRR